MDELFKDCPLAVEVIFLLLIFLCVARSLSFFASPEVFVFPVRRGALLLVVGLFYLQTHWDT